MEWKYGDVTSKIIGAAMEVHRNLGCGLPEHVYHCALEIEFPVHGVQVISEYSMPIFYKGVQIASQRVDFLVDNIITSKIKAVGILEDSHLAQALNYLETCNLEIGMLPNFGASSHEYKRIINKRHKVAQS